MAASFPTSVKSFATLVDLVDSVLASHQNDRALEITAIENYLIETATEKTVSSGTLTVDKSRHKVQPESGTSDDIATISGMPDGGMLFLYASDAGTDTLTLKHGTGNLSCFGASDLALSTGFAVCYRSGSTVYVAGGGGAGSTVNGIRPNVLYGGGMRVVQRGAGPFTSATTFVNNDDVYLLDGVILLSDGNDIVDVSQVADTDFVSGYKIRLDVETANKRFGILLPVENQDIQTIRKAGTASLQFKVKCTGTSMSNVRASLLAWDGTADSITSDVISAWGAAGANPTLVANWTAENTASNLAVTTTIATHQIQNITVDTASVANLAVLIIVDDTDASVGDYLEIGDVKLEHGTTCTDYVNPDYKDEYSRALRYYFRIAPGASSKMFTSGGVCFSTTVYGGVTVFPVPLRIVPTAIQQNGTATDYAVYDTAGSQIACSAVPAYNSLTTQYMAWTNLTVAAGLTAGATSVAATAAGTTAGYLAWSAEL